MPSPTRVAHTPLPPLTATAIGSMPQEDGFAAARCVLAALPDLPAWPQLALPTPLASRFASAAAAIPGARLGDDGTLRLPEGFPEPRPSDPVQPLPWVGEAEIGAVLDGRGLKRQTVGPVTLALHTRLADGRLVAHDWNMAKALVTMVRSAPWRIVPRLFLFDEPELQRGLRYEHLGRSRCAALLSIVLRDRPFMAGVHCCCEPDFQFLAELPLDVISFDAFRYRPEAVRQSDAIGAFLERGGEIAWGIVPANSIDLAASSARSLAARLARLWQALAERGVSATRLAAQSLITPTCGLALLTEAEAEWALQLTTAVSEELRPLAAALGIVGVL